MKIKTIRKLEELKEEYLEELKEIERKSLLQFEIQVTDLRQKIFERLIDYNLKKDKLKQMN